MTDNGIAVVVQKLDSMDAVLKDHGETLKDLSRAFTAQAVQNEQLQTVKTRVDAMWNHVDRIKAHQAQCPRTQLTRLWWAIGLLGTMYAATLVIVLAQVAKGG